MLEADLRAKGCNIYHVPALHSDRKRHISAVRKIIKDGRYDIVHVSQGYKGFLFLLFAKMYGVKVRIAHSHMAYIPETIPVYLVRKCTAFLSKLFATHLFACGKDAAVWMWGKRAYNSGKVHIMQNAIDLKRFAFSPAKRADVRKQLHVEHKFVVGNVARFTYQKNHEFLIEIFKEIRRKKQNAVLVLVGGGELEPLIRKQARDHNLEDAVMFLGVRNDIAELLNAMDVFLLPSRFEGLPVTLVEVQANGLPAFVSAAVTKEIQISSGLQYLPLEQSAEEWADQILTADMDRGACKLTDDCYDIDIMAARQKQLYKSLV